MIRHDYILKMIEEFIQAMAQVGNLKEKEAWKEAGLTLDEQFRRLVRTDATGARILTEPELMARLMEGSSTTLTRQKTFMLATLFKEAGDLAAGRQQGVAARSFYLKGLHLLLLTLRERDAGEIPEYVPAVEVILKTLQEEVLPMETSALLMQYYEQTGQFARLEDSLFELLELEPEQPAILSLGLGIYQRLMAESDETLMKGGLPREEVEMGMRELEKRLERLDRGC